MTRSCILLVAVAAVGLHAADDVDCSGMKMKALRQWLTARGLRCDGCAEKADYVALCEANHNAPVVPPEEEEIAAVDELLKRQSGGPKVRTPGSGKDADIDELLKSMKGIPGMENIKMFRPEDIDKLAAEGKQGSGSKSAEQWRDELVSEERQSRSSPRLSALHLSATMALDGR